MPFCLAVTVGRRLSSLNLPWPARSVSLQKKVPFARVLTSMNLVVPNFKGKADRDYAQDNALDYTVLCFEKAKTIAFILVQEGTSVRAYTAIV